MAETTAQDIAGGAGLFSSILGPVGVGVQLFGAGMQIAQAAKARRAQRSAERAAADKVAAARRELSVNRLEGLQVPTSAFEQATQADIAMQQQALAGLAESDPRALAAGIGKVQAMGTQATETRRQAMEKSLFDYEKMVAAEQQRIDQAMAGISLQEAAGAQLARKQAEEQFGQAVTGAIGAIGGAAQTAYEQTQLYKRQKEASPFQQAAIQKTATGEMDYRKFRDTRLKNDYTVGQGLPGVQQSFNQPAYGGGIRQGQFTLESVPMTAFQKAAGVDLAAQQQAFSGLGFQSLSPNIQGL